jgi:hypothetical protein
MNALGPKRKQRKSQPTVELLDMRIVPTSMAAEAGLAVELKVEARQVHRFEVSLESARPGSRHDRMLIKRIGTEEQMMTRQEVRLDGIVAQAGGMTTGTGSQNSLPANVAVTLDVVYDAYQQNPGQFPANLPATDGANLVVIQGSNVGIQVHDGNPTDFATLLTELESDGMQVTTSSAQFGTIVGMLPISQLPAVAELTDAPSVAPLWQSSLKA